MTEKEPNRDLVAIKKKQQVLFVRGNLELWLVRAHVDETFSGDCPAVSRWFLPVLERLIPELWGSSGGFIRSERVCRQTSWFLYGVMWLCCRLSSSHYEAMLMWALWMKALHVQFHLFSAGHSNTWALVTKQSLLLSSVWTTHLHPVSYVAPWTCQTANHGLSGCDVITPQRRVSRSIVRFLENAWKLSSAGKSNVAEITWPALLKWPCSKCRTWSWRSRLWKCQECAERGSDHVIGSHFSSAGAKTSSLSSAAETDESLAVALWHQVPLSWTHVGSSNVKSAPLALPPPRRRDLVTFSPFRCLCWVTALLMLRPHGTHKNVDALGLTS